MRRIAAVVLASVIAVAPAGCGEEDDPETDADFSSDRVAPPVGEGAGEAGSETEPDPEESVLELELDSGATVVLWVDPDDYRKVYQQHSHPISGDAWTEPELLFEAGDGCQGIQGDTNGETVAATLECYEDDLFIQQAPDQGQAVVTQDLEEWDVHDAGELYGACEVSDDGDEVTWEESDLSWTEADGFV